MKAFEVLVSARAQRDLTVAREYIARFAPETAERWYADFLNSLTCLEQDPHVRPLAPENDQFSFELRQYIFRSASGKANRALFTIVGSQVRILAVRRPGQPLVQPADLQDD